MRRSLSFGAIALLLAGGIPDARAALDEFGQPIDPHGFPEYYAAGGLQLEPCLPSPAGYALNRPDLCVFDPLEPGPLAVGAEMFYWMAEASAPPLAAGGKALLVLALEGAFANEVPIDGEQMPFGRVRIRVDVPVAGDYRVIHPYGTIDFPNVTVADGINYTSDIGDINFVNPALGFAGALGSDIGGPTGSTSFLTWPDYELDPTLQYIDPLNPEVVLEQYIGDPNIPHEVTGGSNGNVFRIEGPDGISTETSLFAVMGKVYDPAAARVPHVFPAPPAPKLFAVGPVNRPGQGTPLFVVPTFGEDLQRDLLDQPATNVLTDHDYPGYPVGIPLWFQERLTVPVLNPDTGEQEIDPDTGEPMTQDVGGVKLTYCPPSDPMCISAPIALDDQEAVDLRMGDEGFWWTAEAFFDEDTHGFDGLLVLALEAAFGGNEAIVDGGQIAFARLRIRIDTPEAGDYTITHPYGVEVFEDVPAGTGAINVTRDFMLMSTSDPANAFPGALFGDVGPRFLTWTDYETDPVLKVEQPVIDEDGNPTGVTKVVQYVGDPRVEHLVTGSPNDTNFFQVDGPSGFRATQTQFSVSGKVFDPETFQAMPTLMANPDSATLDLALNPSVTINVLGNDTFQDGAPIVVTILPATAEVGPVAGASVAVNLDSTVTYTPAPGFSGVDTFAYQMTDVTGVPSNIAIVTVTVIPVESITVTQARFDLRRLQLDIRGTSNFDGSILDIYPGDTGGTPIGSAVVSAGTWRYRGTATTALTSIRVAARATGTTTIPEVTALQVR
jgi:hypothetical protein